MQIQSIRKIGALSLAPILTAILTNVLVLQAVAQTNASFSINPQFSEPAVSHPMLMLTLAGDHQVFMKAYNDFDDLDGDDLPDVTYNHNVVYKGYFNDEKCYTYGSGVFTPAADATAPTAVDNTLGIKTAGLSIKQYCSSSRWSGNFLNWATMTRIDIVRSVLYGGKRSTDTASSTVLERTYLPNDGHSFAKYYNGSDLTKLTGISSSNFVTNNVDKKQNGLTFCNTSLGHVNNKTSQEQSTFPAVRVARGNYSLWASGERFQCLLGYDNNNQKEFEEYAVNAFGDNGNDSSITGIHAYSDVPFGKTKSGTHWLADYTVRVAVCTDSVEDDIHFCRRYGTSYKPTGLLQTYGIHSDNPVLFGLMTNAVNRNKSAGVLRKNVSPMLNEVDTANGTFLRPSTGSIVSSIDAMELLDHHFRKVVGFDYNFTGTYNETCKWFRSGFDEGKCRNWGNPFTEILAESYRYLAGNNNQPTLTAQERTNETTALSGSTAPAWQDPFTQATTQACVNLNVLGINSSSVSYDADFAKLNGQSRTFANMGIGNSTQTLVDWTDLVGAGEIDTSKKYFVGSNGSSNDGQCTPKSVTKLSAITGTCPETPRLEGSYLAAGLAYYAKANNIRPDKFASTGKTFGVNTLGLTLSGTQPIITIPGTDVKIIPACRNKRIDTESTPNKEAGNCALVGFRPIYTSAQKPSKYFVTWEDTEQGADFDQDLNGIIEYTKSETSITVKTTIFNSSTSANVQLGYIISGTTNDGLKLPTQVNPDTLTNTANFTIGSSDAFSLESPLYYATKWGSYINAPEDTDAKFDPTKDTWTEDGKTPQNYALVTNPGTLRESLGKILVKAGKSGATATAAPVSMNSLTGEGIFLQTVYQPVYISPDGSSSATWVGTLSALFLDSNGNVREDSDSNQKLDLTDKVIEFIKVDFETQNADDVTEKRKVIAFNRYPFSQALGGKDTSDPNDVELNLSMDKLKTMWSARDRLAAISDTNIVLQRGSGESANQKRFIITGLDEPNASNVYDGMITGNETIAFAADDTTAGNLRNHLHVATTAEAKNVINFIRGKEIAGFRNRTVKFASTGTAKVWRLGDIVNSTPAIVGAPSAGYDVFYGDTTYENFKKKYAKRRNMVYVGANDGLLHAFNAGFFDTATAKFIKAPPGATDSTTELGAEMWAYAPYNLLPHLKWLSRTNYEHVFYVDANVKVFDAKIFASKNNETKYPGGWGTILAVGMRYGGGEYEIDRDGNAATTTDKTKLRSAYIIFDITDPESTPELIAEVTTSGLGYTLADPEVIKRIGKSGETVVNDWYMVFGSGPQGPDAVKEGVSNVPAKLFYLDLKNAVAQDVTLTAVAADAAGTKSFVGGITAKDWDNDYRDDMIYFGLVGNDNRGSGVPTPAPAAYKGVLKQAVISTDGSVLNDAGVSALLRQSEVNFPFSSAPLAVRDGLGRFWVFAGTGRFLVNKDMSLSHDNFYHGIRVDTNVSGSKTWIKNSYVALSSLQNVTNDKLYVSSAGDLRVRNSAAEKPLAEYLTSIASKSGWYRKFATKESNFSKSAFYEGTLIFNAYKPAVNICEIGGTSPQYILDMFTGLPQYRLKTVFKGTDTLTYQTTTFTELVPVGTVIQGIASSPVIANARAVTQTSDAALKAADVSPVSLRPVRRAWREVQSDELR